MKLFVVLGVIGALGIVASFYSQISQLRDQRDAADAKVQQLSKELDAARDYGSKLYKERQSIEAESKTDASKLRAALERADLLEKQSANLASALQSEQSEAEQLRGKLVKAEQSVAATPQPASIAVNNAQAAQAQLKAMRQTRLDQLRTRLLAAPAWEQALVSSMDQILSSGSTPDAQYLNAARRSPLAQKLLAIYRGDLDAAPMESASDRYQRAYEAASPSQKMWADHVSALIEKGATAEDLAADPLLSTAGPQRSAGRRPAGKSGAAPTAVALRRPAALTIPSTCGPCDPSVCGTASDRSI